MSTTYQVSGMSCGKCVAKVQAALANLTGDASVTLSPPRATLNGTLADDLPRLNEELAKLGNYSLQPVAADAAPSPLLIWLKTYRPLLVIVGLITLASLTSDHFMSAFMAGFFIVFGGFKLFDLKGFADAYASYDLLAVRSRAYAYLYPFLELALGFAYLTHTAPRETAIATIILMGFGSIGVIKAVLNKQQIRCACLGTALNLPMSTITIVEDIGMVLMAAWMLIGLN